MQVNNIKYTIMETIQERLVAFRVHTSLNKKAFADKIGLNSGLYGRYESGENKPSFETLEKIAASFPKLSLNWLLTGKGEMLLTAVVAAVPAAPTPGLTSGAATVAEAENVLLRQQLADKDKQMAKLTEMLEWVKNLVPTALGKLLSSPDAAYHGQPLRALAGGC